jgi:hypothetical protein
MHVRRALALAVTVPLLLAGCSEKAEPTPKMPDPTASSSSPTPTESETPEAESAEEFIRRWVEAGDEMQVTGETATYSEMSPDCKACQGFVAAVKAVYRAGGHAEFAGTEITGMRRRSTNPPTFEVSENVPETVIHHGDTGKTERLPAGKTRIQVILKKSEAGWLVSYFGILT